MRKCITSTAEKFSKIINQNLVIAIKILMKFGVDTYDKSSLYDLVVKRINMEELLKEYFADFERVEQRVLELNDEAEERKKIKALGVVVCRLLWCNKGCNSCKHLKCRL